MGKIDKSVFEARGAHGCSDSGYEFAMTSCCERVGVIDDELDDFYWNPDTPTQSVSLLEDPDCPYCGASSWRLMRLEQDSHVPEHWRWACDGRQRSGSRRVRPLAEYVRELVESCRRVASPFPDWSEVLIVDAEHSILRHDEGRAKGQRSLVPLAEFAPRFEALLLSGYPRIELSVLGVQGDRLVVAVELPEAKQGVAPGRTAVTYSGPPRGSDGAYDWTFRSGLSDASEHDA